MSNTPFHCIRRTNTWTYISLITSQNDSNHSVWCVFRFLGFTAEMIGAECRACTATSHQGAVKSFHGVHLYIHQWLQPSALWDIIYTDGVAGVFVCCHHINWLSVIFDDQVFISSSPPLPSPNPLWACPLCLCFSEGVDADSCAQWGEGVDFSPHESVIERYRWFTVLQHKDRTLHGKETRELLRLVFMR